MFLKSTEFVKKTAYQNQKKRKYACRVEVKISCYADTSQYRLFPNKFKPRLKPVGIYVDITVDEFTY